MTSLVRKVINLMRGSRAQLSTLGVEFSSEGVAFAQILRPAGKLPRVLYCEFLPLEPGQDAAELLASHLDKLDIARVPCNLVMTSGSYQLLLGEAPKVPQEELAEALRWRVKDLVQFPIADAVMDALLLPEDSARGASRMAYAVVAQRKQIESLVEFARAARLELQSIDISEMALRNLVDACCDSKRGVALVKLTQGAGQLQIYREGNLYLSRQFAIAYNAGLLDDIPEDALVLDLQRSLDYFERQMRQVPPGNVFVCGENVTADKITPAMKSAFGVSLDTLDLSLGLDFEESVPLHSLPLCLNALGAALRQDTVGGGS